MRDSRYYARMYVDKTSDYVSDCVGYVWQCVCQVQEYWSYMSEYIHVIDVSDYVAVVPWIHWRHMTHMTCRVSPCIIDCMSDVSSKYQDGDHLTQSNFAKRNPTHFGVLRFEKKYVDVISNSLLHRTLIWHRACASLVHRCIAELQSLSNLTFPCGWKARCYLHLLVDQSRLTPQKIRVWDGSGSVDFVEPWSKAKSSKP